MSTWNTPERPQRPQLELHLAVLGGDGGLERVVERRVPLERGDQRRRLHADARERPEGAPLNGDGAEGREPISPQFVTLFHTAPTLWSASAVVG